MLSQVSSQPVDRRADQGSSRSDFAKDERVRFQLHVMDKLSHRVPVPLPIGVVGANEFERLREEVL
jgi:hypothetical protein